MRAAAFAVAFVFAVHAATAGSASKPRTLLLEIWLNGRNTQKIVQVVATGTDLLLRRQDADGIGLKLSGMDDPVPLRALPGVTAQLDERNQRLLIAAIVASLKPQVFDLRPSETDGEAIESTSGAALNYDFSASAADVRHLSRTASVGGHLALAIFTPVALFTTDGFAATGQPGESGARLDSALEFDDTAHVRRLALGDAISGNLDWSRAVRFGGVQFASDFSLRPDLVTLPLPQFFGTAAVPSTVDVFSGAVRLYEQDVAPGPFELDNLPVVTGGGTATIVVRDMLGRENAQTISFYAAGRLLAPGLTSYDFDAGFLRRDYGWKSFAYGTPMAMFTVRHGMDAQLTLEAHGEAAPNGALAGGGFAFGLGDMGAMSVDLAASRSAYGTGALASLGLEGWVAPVKIFGAFAGATKDYSDVAMLDADPVSVLRYQLGAAISLDRFGALAATWIGKKDRGEPATDLVSASYSLSPGNGLFFGLTGLRDIAGHSWAAQAYVSVPLGDGFATSNVDFRHPDASAQAAYTVPADPDGGMGWRSMGQGGENDRFEGEASYVGARGEYDGAGDISKAGFAARADASGALVLMDGSIFATRKPDGAMALVKAGSPDVRIYRENREVAVSGADGDALLTGLVPYAPNHIAIEPRDYPLVTAVQKTERTVVPRRMGGVIVALAPDATHSLMARFTLPDGAIPPVGATVDVDGSSVPLMVGRNGEVFFANLDKPATGAIVLGGKRCAFSIAPSVSSMSVPNGAQITCTFGQSP